MPKKVFTTLGIFLVFTLVVLLSFKFDSKSKFTAMESSGKTIELKNTTWELVEYTDGPEVKNMVGTDWILQFDREDGFVRLCDTHPFSFYTFKDTVNFNFTKKNDTTCQDDTIGASEETFFSFFKSTPTAERVSDSNGKFKEVLTLTEDTKKLIFVPRTTIETGDALNKTKNVVVTAELCPPVSKAVPTPTCTPYASDFTVAPIDQEKSITTPFTTDAKGIGTVSLPKGSYQVSMKTSTASVTFSPIIFSIADTSDAPYPLALKVVSKK